MILWILISSLLLLWLSAFFSSSETALYSMSQVKMNYQVEQGERRARVLAWLTRPISPTIITILIGNNIVAEMLARNTERSLAFLGPWSVLAATLILTPLVLIFAEFLPKRIARKHADTVVNQITYVLAGVRILLFIPVTLARIAARILQFLIPGGSNAEIWEPHTSRPNLRTFIRNQERAENVTEVQQRLIDRVLALERITTAYEGVSKPLENIPVLDGSKTLAETKELLGPKYFQRYLVAEKAGEQPTGWVSAATLVCSDDNTALMRCAQELPTLEETTPLHIALQQMHARGADMALVCNDAGTITRVAFRNDGMRVLMQLD